MEAASHWTSKVLGTTVVRDCSGMPGCRPNVLGTTVYATARGCPVAESQGLQVLDGVALLDKGAGTSLARDAELETSSTTDSNEGCPDIGVLEIWCDSRVVICWTSGRSKGGEHVKAVREIVDQFVRWYMGGTWGGTCRPTTTEAGLVEAHIPRAQLGC